MILNINSPFMYILNQNYGEKNLSNKLLNEEEILMEKEIQKQRGMTLLNDLAREKGKKKVDIYTSIIKPVGL